MSFWHEMRNDFTFHRSGGHSVFDAVDQKKSQVPYPEAQKWFSLFLERGGIDFEQ